jgi:glycosyltransferase involved in cell wall biosynthesis
VHEVLVVDSYSTDGTVAIAMSSGVKLLQRKFVNYADQYNWALSRVPHDCDWVLRIDADEYVTPDLVDEINCIIPTLPADVHGIVVGRSVRFLGCHIRYGGVFPVRVLRVFRSGKGRCERRWMDEHVIVTGRTVTCKGALIDDNRNSLSWWIDKHNRYASREAVDLLNLEFCFAPFDSVADMNDRAEASRKRWLKEKVYSRMPLGVRALLYFVYRVIVRLGFLDGATGMAYHFFQGLWYRFLVDQKIREVKAHMSRNQVDIRIAIREVLQIVV